MGKVKRRACGRKRQYSTEQFAKRIADKIMSRPDHPEKVEVWQCPICHSWHIGHMPKKIVANILDV